MDAYNSNNSGRKCNNFKIEGHTFKDISTKLNLQRANVKKIFDSAVNKIRETNKYD